MSRATARKASEKETAAPRRALLSVLEVVARLRKEGVHLIAWYPAKVQATTFKLSIVTFCMAIRSRGSGEVLGLMSETILNSHGHIT